MESLEKLGTNFSRWDWLIVAAYLSATVAIGLYVRRYIRNMADYVVAGRSLKSFIAIATMIGTELGLVTVMYSAQKGFTGGFAAFHIGLVAGVVTLIVGFTGFIVVPLREMGVMTIPEFYEKRFGRGVRILGGLLLAGAGILNMGLFLKAGAIFLTGLTGLHDPMYVNIVMSVLIVLVLLYTILGGMVSVVITDYIQFVVLSFGMLLACFFALQQVGWSNIVEAVRSVHQDAGFNPFDTKGFGPTYVVWQVFVAGLVSCAIWQTAVMRACAAESTQVVKRLYIWSSIGFMIRYLIPMFLGVCALTFLWQDQSTRQLFFKDGAPIKEMSMHAMPVLLSQVLPLGMIGLVGAGMLAAFMSTHDSYFLCWSSVLVQDVIDPILGGGLSTKARLTLARVLIFLIGAFLLIWSLWYPLEQDLWEYMAVSGAIYYTGAFALLLAGLYWKRASRVGAYLALICGALAVFGLDPGKRAIAVAATELRVADHASIDDESKRIDIVTAPTLRKLGAAEKVSIGEEHIVLTTTTVALVLMVAGSLLFPDKRAPQHLQT